MRTLQFGLAAVASVAVISTAVLALWLVGSATGDRERFSSLEIAPQDAVFYMAINTDPTSSQWLAVDDVLGTLNAKDPIRKAIDEELAKFDLEFERDIMPLAGDEGYLAVTDVEALRRMKAGLSSVSACATRRGRSRFFSTSPSKEKPSTSKRSTRARRSITPRSASQGTRWPRARCPSPEDVMVVGVAPDDVKGVIDVIQGRAPNATGKRAAARAASAAGRGLPRLGVWRRG